MPRIRINDLAPKDFALTEEDVNKIQGGGYFDGRLLAARDLADEQTYNRPSTSTGYILFSYSAFKID